ncbi:MAG: DUF6992 family protein [Candidatus Kapaibacteriota bacterium]
MENTHFIRFTFVSSFIIFFMGIQALAEQSDSLLHSFNLERMSIQQTGMQTLGIWALTNIAIGTYASMTTSGERQSFWQMNAGWNIVNVGIAGMGYFSQSIPTTLSATIHEQSSIETLLAFNAGLDIAYIIGGLYMKEKANTSDTPERLRGFGNAIMLQGAFLFIFDAILYGVHAHHGSSLPTIIQSMYISTQGIGLNITF